MRPPAREMHVLALELELRVPLSRSLKDKRAVIRPVIDGIRSRYPVAVAEVDHQDKWQRAAVGLAAVSAAPGHAEEMIADVERFVWSFPNLEVIATARHWMEAD